MLNVRHIQFAFFFLSLNVIAESMFTGKVSSMCLLDDVHWSLNPPQNEDEPNEKQHIPLGSTDEKDLRSEAGASRRGWRRRRPATQAGGTDGRRARFVSYNQRRVR